MTAHLLLPYPGGLPSSCLLKSRLKVTPRETRYHPYLPDNTSHQSINPFSMRMIGKEPARHSDPQGAMLCYVIRCIPQAEGRDHRNRSHYISMEETFNSASYMLCILLLHWRQCRGQRSTHVKLWQDIQYECLGLTYQQDAGTQDSKTPCYW